MLNRRLPKVVMFPDGNFLAHMSRLLEIALVLRAEFGYDVVFAGDGPQLRFVEQQGFPVERCFTVPGHITLKLARRGFLVDPVWWRCMVARSIQSDIDVIRRQRPNVVVGDMRWSLTSAARRCEVPCVSVANASWTRYASYDPRAFDGHVLTTLLGARLATRMFPSLKLLLLWYWGLPFSARARGPRTHASLFDAIEGDLTLLADVPEFCPVRNLPASARIVGPLLWNCTAPAPTWLDRLDPSRITVYVSVGSTGSEELLRTAVRAFAGSPVQLIVTTGGAKLRQPVDSRNTFVTSFAPGARLMKRANISLNHGGNGTLYQALASGVPVVGVPDHVDQQLQLQLCERAGVGRQLPKRELTAKRLRAVVDDVVRDNGYVQNARRLRDAIARYDSPRLAAQAVADMVCGPTTVPEIISPASTAPAVEQ